MTADRSQPMTVVKAMMDFFGMDAKALIAEWKPLTDTDKEFFRVELRAQGYTLVDPA